MAADGPSDQISFQFIFPSGPKDEPRQVCLAIEAFPCDLY